MQKYNYSKGYRMFFATEWLGRLMMTEEEFKEENCAICVELCEGIHDEEHKKNCIFVENWV